MSSAQVDPHGKMRARDVSKVATGQQAPRPVHEPGTVSKPPPPSSTDDHQGHVRLPRMLLNESNVAPFVARLLPRTSVVLEPLRFEMEERAKANAIADEIRRCYARFRKYHKFVTTTFSL
ncbi:hypothetical protein HAX54_046673 [Datura stramonium]|uniref:Uncharacterized protein n=1 Tax=Datura stramonium TaxID=4076 RepID=A0ABS8RPT3_DATST|nr:hypothetical protein [Datura stramonium]